MKKLNLLLGVLTLTLFLSCSSDDDNGNNASLLIGGWNLIEFNGDPNIGCPLTLIFTETQVTENEFYGNECELLDSITDPYTLEGNTLTIQTDVENFVITILSITESEMELEQNDPDTNIPSSTKFERIQ